MNKREELQTLHRHGPGTENSKLENTQTVKRNIKRKYERGTKIYVQNKILSQNKEKVGDQHHHQKNKQ